ncbi:MAG: HAD hydrolase family protein [Kaiparowitsia implicata GSE-PSE-MK54-09C]|nr:HAD hydrolase family protein [Kaiparowitsia implicata GSE-PSE-MK54-09C]
MGASFVIADFNDDVSIGNDLLIIFTDLDGTLLEPENYRFDAAESLLVSLKTQQVPVIPVTSKTRLEVEHLRQILSSTDPFVVENGSAVMVEPHDNRFLIPATHSVAPDSELASYQLLQLGCSYAQARQGLQAVATQLGTTLQGFADLGEAEVERLTGLLPNDVKRARAREFSEPFVTPRHIPPDHVKEVVAGQGFRVVLGDRFSHLIGPHAGKGHAVRALTQHFQSPASEPVTTIGLGNSPNDREMLEAVDVPIIVPGRNGPHPGLLGKDWAIAPFPGAKGWAEAITSVLEVGAVMAQRPSS